MWVYLFGSFVLGRVSLFAFTACIPLSWFAQLRLQSALPTASTRYADCLLCECVCIFVIVFVCIRVRRRVPSRCTFCSRVWLEFNDDVLCAPGSTQLLPRAQATAIQQAAMLVST